MPSLVEHVSFGVVSEPVSMSKKPGNRWELRGWTLWVCVSRERETVVVLSAPMGRDIPSAIRSDWLLIQDHRSFITDWCGYFKKKTPQYLLCSRICLRAATQSAQCATDRGNSATLTCHSSEATRSAAAELYVEGAEGDAHSRGIRRRKTLCFIHNNEWRCRFGALKSYRFIYFLSELVRFFFRESRDDGQAGLWGVFEGLSALQVRASPVTHWRWCMMGWMHHSGTHTVNNLNPARLEEPPPNRTHIKAIYHHATQWAGCVCGQGMLFPCRV